MRKRNIGQEVLDSMRAIKRGEGKWYSVDLPCDPRTIRERLKLGPSAFASLLGVSLRTVHAWEQGKRKPSGAAKSLLIVAAKRPDVLVDMLKETEATTIAHSSVEQGRTQCR
jgi:putative transcriptional regulator